MPFVQYQSTVALWCSQPDYVEAMCWTSECIPVRQVAETDIKVYKVVNDKLGSVFFPFQYKIGEPASTVQLQPKRMFDLWAINEGYHSYSSEDGARRDWEGSTGNKCLFEAVIPKDSEYYVSGYEVVSSSLTLKEYIENV